MNLFTLASLAGGFATDQAWLLTARAVQGVGAAFAAPTSLSLIAVTFPEGRERNRAMGVYAAVSVSGAAVGLIAGGLLVSYLDWRWVLFVNVPIGALVALFAPRVLAESERRRGNFDLPGAITASLGLSSLVYGLSSAATTSNGVSHWGDTKVIVSLAAAVVLLVAFVVIESRARHPLMPFRVLRSSSRSGAYLISLCVGTALTGMFFFLTLFVQGIWGYSPLRTGIAYLPMVAALMIASMIASQLVSRIGARPLMIAGAAAGGGTVAWSAVASNLRSAAAAATASAAAAAKAGHPVHLSPAAAKAARTAMANYAMAYGFSHGYLVSAGVMLLGLVFALALVRLRREDLSGVNPMAAPVG